LHPQDGKDLISRKIEMLNRPRPTIETKTEIRHVLQRMEDIDEFND
jgi:hypothetical protein